jgi:uncharacterized protein (TIGR00297 family)
MDGPLGWAVLAAQVLAVGVLSWFAYHKGWLTASAAGVAFALGAAIVLATNVLWLLVLVSLLAFTALATRFKYREKVARGTAEGRGGARRIRNVLANGLVATLIAALYPLMSTLEGPVNWDHVAALTFVSAVAAASADTLASELGSLSDKVYLITSWRRVPPGTDGGVSLAGQGAALLGAGLIALLGLLLLGLVGPRLWPGPSLELAAGSVWVPILAGFVGCQVDSVLGATLEIRGLVSKEEVNILGIASATVLGFALGVMLS